MLGHVALNEERAGVGVEAASDEERQVERRLAQCFGLLRHGDRVHVDDGVDASTSCCSATQRPDGADEVAEVLLAVGWIPERTRIGA